MRHQGPVRVLKPVSGKLYVHMAIDQRKVKKTKKLRKGSNIFPFHGMKVPFESIVNWEILAVFKSFWCLF